MSAPWFKQENQTVKHMARPIQRPEKVKTEEGVAREGESLLRG